LNNYELKMEKFSRLVDNVTEISGNITSWATSLLVLIVVVDVAARYLFSESSVALQELEWHLFAFIFLGAAAYTLKQNEHVRVDLFYSKCSERKKAIINIIGVVLFLLPFTIVTITSSFDFISASFRFGETSPDPGGLPARYVIKSLLPLSFLLILLQGIVIIGKSVKVLTSGDKK